MVDLQRMRKLMNRLPIAQFKLDRAMAQATRTTTVLTGMPRGGGSDMQDKAIMVTLARERRDAIANELTAMREELTPVIENLDNPLQRSAMTLRYINGMSVREIAYSLTYSEQHLFRVLKDAERKTAENEKTEN